MKGPISLVEELRAIRNESHPGNKPKPFPNFSESARPWQADVDRVQETLQGVLQAVSRFSGVEFPGVTHDSPKAGNPLPLMDSKTLKDRIRNDLEAFSIKTTEELAKRAEEQTRAAMGAIKNEVNGQIEQVAGEFREKLKERLEPGQLEIDLSKQSRERVAELVQVQTEEFARWVWLTCKGTGTPIPVQIEKLLEPYVEETTAKFMGAMRQQVQNLLAEQEQYIQERLRGTISSLQSQVAAMEQTAQQICEQKADAVTKASEERLAATANEAAKGLEDRIREATEGTLGRFQTRLEELATASQERLQRKGDLQAESFSHKIEALATEAQEKSVSEISSRIAQTAADVVESSVQHLRQQAGDALEQSKGELKGFMQLQAEEVKATSESVMQELSNRVNASASVLRDEAIQATSRIESSVSNSLETYRQQLAQLTDAGLEEHRKAIAGSMSDLHSRLTQASKLLMGGN